MTPGRVSQAGVVGGAKGEAKDGSRELPSASGSSKTNRNPGPRFNDPSRARLGYVARDLGPGSLPLLAGL